MMHPPYSPKNQFSSRLFFIALLLLFLNGVQAQVEEGNFSAYVDSVYQVLDTMENDTKRIEHAVDIAIYEQNLGKKLSLLRRLNSTSFEAMDTTLSKIWFELSLSHLGTGYLDSSDYFSAKVLETSLEHDHVKGKLYAYNIRAHIASQRGNFEEAIETYFLALETIEGYEGERKLENKASILGNLSGVFFYLDDLESSKKYVAQEMAIGKQLGNGETVAYARVRMGIMEDQLQNYDSAIYHSLEAEKLLLALEPPNETLLTNCYGTLGSAYIGKQQWSSANRYIGEGIALCRKNNDITNLFDLLKEQSRVYLALGRNDAAEKSADEAYSLLNSNSGYGDLQSVLEAKIDVAKAKGQFKSAYELYVQLDLHKDSITTLEAKKNIAELQTEFETERKEAEIERLSLENDLQAANLAKARSTQFAIGIGSGMAILVLAIFFVQRNKKLKAEREAQELQVEALKKRFMELHSSPAELAVSLQYEELNSKLNTPLTEREFEALKLSIEGKSNAEISEALFISLSTVKFHLRNTYSKMGVGNRKEAFQYMLKTS